MASEVHIANLALTKLGAKRLLLLSDENNEARTISALFNDVRDAELRRHNWSFAIRRAQLMALVEKPAFEYAHQFPLPDDFLKLVSVGDHVIVRGQHKPWVLEGKRLLTNLQAPLRIRYVRREKDTSLFDPLFIEAFACKLAMEACEALTQSQSKWQQVAQQYERAIQQAKKMDAIERLPDVLPDGEWLDSRGFDTGYASGDPWQAYPSGV